MIDFILFGQGIYPSELRILACLGYDYNERLSSL